jgi:flagellin|tara:strand:- start:451 stop:1578 length:1128 start_codon:yes stop_codon:yes gene_type:complete
MGLVVNTNVASLNAQRSLAASGLELKTAMERLSSGKKINSAADDAAGFAIAERMTAQIRGLNMAAKNASDGLSMLATIENATNDVTDMLQRIRELAVQAVNDTNGSGDRNYLQSEVTSLLAEIDRVATQTVYNNMNLLDGSRQGNIQVGTESGQNIQFSISSIQTTDIGKEDAKATVADIAIADTNVVIVNYAGTDTTITASGATDDARLTSLQNALNTANVDVTVSKSSTAGQFTFTADNKVATPISIKVGADATAAAAATATASSSNNNQMLSAIDITTSAKATDALATITAAIEQVAGHRASYGALQNRLEYTVSNLMNVAEWTNAARSRIEDADFAAESARLAKAQVLQQTGTAMLAQANAASQLALQLIK